MIHVFEDKTVRSRKKHRCYHCLKYIGVGKTYTLREFVDGGFGRMRMHPECEAIALQWKIYGEYQDDGIYEGLLLDEANDRFSNYLMSQKEIQP